tara:strand:- start:108 stop:473 length:366 start_codon:yes stop_codon:yes gene_type:complete
MYVPIDMDTAILMILVGSIVFFSLYLARISNELRSSLTEIGDTGQDLDEIKESIELVAAILNKLPELMPQFQMNTNPLQPIFEAFARKLSGEQPLMTYQPEQGAWPEENVEARPVAEEQNQ